MTVQFSSFGVGLFDPNFYSLDGIAFPPQRCGSLCFPWEVGWLLGEDALLGGRWGGAGLVTASFTRPVSDLSLSFAPDLQGTATYVLTAYSASGQVVGRTSLTVTEDYGDPANEGFGYRALSLTDLPHPAKSFDLDSIFVRSSFPNLQKVIGYGVRSISYTHWGSQH